MTLVFGCIDCGNDQSAHFDLKISSNVNLQPFVFIQKLTVNKQKVLELRMSRKVVIGYHDLQTKVSLNNR
jgi:hypothetical protein